MIERAAGNRKRPEGSYLIVIAAQAIVTGSTSGKASKTLSITQTTR